MFGAETRHSASELGGSNGGWAESGRHLGAQQVRFAERATVGGRKKPRVRAWEGPSLSQETSETSISPPPQEWDGPHMRFPQAGNLGVTGKWTCQRPWAWSRSARRGQTREVGGHL